MFIFLGLLGTFLSWISLVILIAVGQGIADLGVPPWPETLWKLAVIAIVGDALVILLPPNVLLVNLVAAVVYWTFMVKWFQVDFQGAIILALLSRFIRVALIWGIAMVYRFPEAWGLETLS